MYTITGTLYKIFETDEVSIDRHYRQFWLKTHENKPQMWRMQLSGLSCAKLDHIDIGKMVQCTFSISGQPSMRNNKQELYNNINAITIDQIN